MCEPFFCGVLRKCSTFPNGANMEHGADQHAEQMWSMLRKKMLRNKGNWPIRSNKKKRRK